MAIRFKIIKTCWFTPRSAQDPSLTEVCVDETVPIRDWSANPTQIQPPNWIMGSAAPASVNLLVVFPELSELVEYKTLYPGGFRFKIKKNINNVDFVDISGSNIGNDGFFIGINTSQSNLIINYKNLSNLSVGSNMLNLLFEAYGITADGTEVFVEDSSVQNIIIPIKLTVISGNDFNTDKSNYLAIYNKADNSFSGDQRIIVYSSNSVTASSDVSYIAFYKTNTPTEIHLNFIANNDLQSLSVGDYSGNVKITRDNNIKNVPVTMRVINDTTLFYVNPSEFVVDLQKNIEEEKTLVAEISNPNNLEISVDVKPYFIKNARVEDGKLYITTENSRDLNLGSYTGSVILKSGITQKSIFIKMTVQEGGVNDFVNAPYFFALDKNKVRLKKTDTSSVYVKMVLDMYFEGYGENHQEIQTYTLPFFKGSVEFYPGQEVQDFFIKATSFIQNNDPEHLYAFANVTMRFIEMTDQDEEISTLILDNLKFAPGKRPKCFPIFTNHSVRRTYANSVINIAVDKLSLHNDLQQLYSSYKDSQPTYSKAFSVCNFQFVRSKFFVTNDIINTDSLELIPFPYVPNIVHIEWENSNLVFEWFSAVEKIKPTTEFEHITSESNLYFEEKFGSSYSKTIIVNTGWILVEEFDLIDEMLQSRLCFLTIKGKKIKAFPIARKNELEDINNNTFCFDLEFRVLIEK